MHRGSSTAAAAFLLAFTTAVGAQGEGDSNNPSAAIKYTDPLTKIDFMGTTHTNPTNGNFQCGIALPQQVGTDVIVNIVSPIKNNGGWGGIEFGNQMAGFLMLVAWVSGPGSVATGARWATGEEASNIFVYNKTDVTIAIMPEGTGVNSTHLYATFLCKQCLTPSSFNASSAGTMAEWAWAYSILPPLNAGDPNPLFTGHMPPEGNYGLFNITPNSAGSSSYSTWAALAGSGAASPGGNNSTATTSGAATKPAGGSTAPTFTQGATTSGAQGKSAPGSGGFQNTTRTTSTSAGGTGKPDTGRNTTTSQPGAGTGTGAGVGGGNAIAASTVLTTETVTEKVVQTQSTTATATTILSLVAVPVAMVVSTTLTAAIRLDGNGPVLSLAGGR